MSNISLNYMDSLPSATMDDLSRPLVFVVDMINGFIKEGNLHDSSIKEIINPIKQVLDNQMNSVFICDSHNLNAREFANYPIHCVEGTDESNVVKELSKYVQNIVYKNSTNAFHAPGFQDELSTYLTAYDDYVIVGCCSDICILQFALTFQGFLNEHNMDNKRIIVPANMIETFHIEGSHDQRKMNECACNLMQAAGIHVVEMR